MDAGVLNRLRMQLFESLSERKSWVAADSPGEMFPLSKRFQILLIGKQNCTHSTGFEARDEGVSLFEKAELIGLCALKRGCSSKVWILAWRNLLNAAFPSLKDGDQLAEAHEDVPIS
jgi:hypothetical protein